VRVDVADSRIGGSQVNADDVTPVIASRRRRVRFFPIHSYPIRLQ